MVYEDGVLGASLTDIALLVTVCTKPITSGTSAPKRLIMTVTTQNSTRSPP